MKWLGEEYRRKECKGAEGWISDTKESSLNIVWKSLIAIYLLTYLLTPRCRVLPEQLTGLQLVKKFPTFHGTPRFITALTSVRQLSVSWASPIQSIYPHPTSWKPILILSTHLHLGLPSGLFPSGFLTRPYTHLSSPIRATCPAHLILLHFITRTVLGKQYRSYSSSLCDLLHSIHIYIQTHRLQWHCLLRNIACSCRACSPFSRRIATIISPLKMNCVTEEWCRIAPS